MGAACRCRALGPGVQTFRIRDPLGLFKVVEDLGPDRERFIDARAVWECRQCGQPFAWLRVIYKDHEEILVRPPVRSWQMWEWGSLAATADRCRWRGPELDERYVL